ncbi:MAG: hypothetical protein L0241_06555, partial [Planctomycetia bacterium]|nr:hypothetical protein [Planctomycetia bacterium]
LIRRQATFTVVPADEKIDPTFVPRIKLDELDKRARTELVQVVIPLKTLVADDLVPDVKKMLGPFGSVVAVNRTNSLIVQDLAGNLQKIVKTLADIDKK